MLPVAAAVFELTWVAHVSEYLKVVTPVDNFAELTAAPIDQLAAFKSSMLYVWGVLIQYLSAAGLLMATQLSEGLYVAGLVLI